MEKQSAEATAVHVVDGGDLGQPVGTRVRRRLVQSTLFPHRNQDNGKENVIGEDGDCSDGQDQDGEEEEYCGSQGKKQKRKRKATPLSRSRASKKVAVNGKESPSTRVESADNEDAPVTINMKSPWKLKRRANATPEKWWINTTPKKNAINGGLEEARIEEIVNNPIQNEQISQQIPNLRLEAKLMAEENLRIFAGRQMHPFFSSWKTSKRSQEAADVESKWFSIEGKDRGITFGPVHVFEKVQDDAVSLDWGNWIFSERSFISTYCGFQNVLSVNDGSIKSLQFDDFPSVFHLTGTSLCQTEISFDQHLIQNEEDHEVGEVDSFSNHAGYERNSDAKLQGKFLQERIISYYHGCCNLPENSLWTNKYQPEKAIEVCGNCDSVKFLSEWLHHWRERVFQTCKASSNGDKFIVEEDDYDCYKSDCESENIDEQDILKNILLVTGPVGSGKSAAIYACAKEQGFQIIEVNASDWRNGALVKQRFGEAVESHWLQCTPENPAFSEQHQSKSSPATTNPTTALVSDNDVIELIPLSDEEYSQNASGTPRKSIYRENKTVSEQSGIKTLLLFEDVDANLDGDHGFIATIQQLAETAKRPMILTSNSNCPVLPNNLDRLEVCFTIPSLEELLCLVNMVCAAEKAKIQPWLVERFIGYCQGDIRKIIMHLQFWCQGQCYGKDSKAQRKYGPLLFDIDAGHETLPKIIPWGCSSQLSEYVEKAISESLSTMVENSDLMNIIHEEADNNENLDKLRMHGNESCSIEAKKEAMLSRHCSNDDVNAFAAPFDTSQFSLSDSPVAFTRRNSRRKFDVVLSSDSGDECFSERVPLASCKPFEDTSNDVLLEVNSKSPPYCAGAERCWNPLTERLLHPEGQNLEESHRSEKAIDYSKVNGICKTIDVSSVPESSFVPETEINDEAMLLSRTVSGDCDADKPEAVSTGIDLITNFLPVDGNGINNYLTESHETSGMLGNSNYVNMESIHGEVANFNIPSAEVFPRGYHVMDECSRMVFSRGSKSIEKPTSKMESNSIQETWTKLRDGHMDLSQYVTPEEKNASKVLKLAHAMCDLISEGDLLLSKCQSVIHDILEPSLVPSEESYSLSWYEDQLQMTSTLAQHGICFYAKEVAGIGSNTCSVRKVDLAWEMLTSSTNTMALGKLVHQDKIANANLETISPKSSSSLKSKLKSRLCNIVQSIVTSRSYLKLKGDAFHEYLSPLCQISRSEASRLSESITNRKRKRARVSKHYLSSGALMLSPEDTSLLSQYNCYSKIPCRSIH